MTAFKLLTHDFRPPVQGGDAVWDGKTFPWTIGPVDLDVGPDECSYGLNYVEDLAEGFKVARLWPTGRPNPVLVVTPSEDAISRGSKFRASSLTLDRLATDDEIADGVRRFSAPFAPHVDRMTGEQLAWRTALSRPGHDSQQVEAGLAAALSARGLGWTVKRFGSAQSAWDAWDAWDARDAWDAWDARAARAARDARDAWDARDARDAWAARAARDARDAWDARAAWAARAARDARDAWDARDARAAWAARAARDARDAWDALSVCFASLQGWIKHDPLLLTTGIRDAYAAGLEIAIPTGPNTLGYAMADEKP